MNKHRECNCPGVVMHCVHFGDTMLVLCHPNSAVQCDCTVYTTPFVVIKAIGQPHECWFGCGRFPYEWHQLSYFYRGESYEEALQIFNKQEAEVH